MRSSTREREVVVQGFVAAGFEEVRETFRENFRRRGELGAAVAAVVDGEPVVDLWGGIRDRDSGAPWEEGTRVLTYSTTKGMSAMVPALLHSRGLLDLDVPVLRYWPEFGCHGKEEITVRQLLAHQAGLSAPDTTLTPELLSDLDRTAALLARQRPGWEPGTRHGYHGISLGLYLRELVRRVDPTGRSLGEVFAGEIAGPLGLEYTIGLPDSVPRETVASIHDRPPRSLMASPGQLPLRFLLGVMIPWTRTYRSLRNPPISRVRDHDSPRFRRLESPASSGFGTARAIARAYGCLAAGGGELGLRRETLELLEAPATPPPGGGVDLVLHLETRFALGFSKPPSREAWGTSMRAYGAFGAGGSFGFADPEERLGFGYVMNRMGTRIHDDPRERALRLAVLRCLRRGDGSGLLR